MNFIDNTATHIASLASYYADKSASEAASAMRLRFNGQFPALVKHYAENAEHYAENARFYRERLMEWLDGADERAARWKMAA